MLTLEQIIEAARQLVPRDRQQLQRWLQEQEAQDRAVVQTDAAPSSLKETPQQQMERFRKAMNWIAKHRTEYLGQWVALEGDRLISHGSDAVEVHRAAKAAGIATPFLEQVVEKEEGPYWGGWL
jgi:uncharacterized protein with von Willebrand factor type A (vWA) domain